MGLFEQVQWRDSKHINKISAGVKIKDIIERKEVNKNYELLQYLLQARIRKKFNTLFLTMINCNGIRVLHKILDLNQKCASS